MSAAIRRQDTEHTAAALSFFAIGLTGYAAIKILAPAFYALGDSRTPMIISLASMLTNFVMNWSLVGVLQERGLALSTSTVALANCGLLYFIMPSGLTASRAGGPRLRWPRYCWRLR